MKTLSILCVILTLIVGKCNDHRNPSCKSNEVQHPNEESPFDLGYQETKKFYPDSLVKHFPVRGDSINWRYRTNTVSERNQPRATSFTTYIISRYKDDDSVRVRKIKEECRYISPLDTNIILIFSFYEDTTVYWDKLSIRHYTTPEARRVANSNLACHDCIPLPMLFDEEYFLDSTTITRISKSFGIYLIDAKPGLFIDKKHLIDHPYVPENWKHGYSRGYAIDESQKIIVYWVTVW